MDGIQSQKLPRSIQPEHLETIVTQYISPSPRGILLIKLDFINCMKQCTHWIIPLSNRVSRVI